MDIRGPNDEGGGHNRTLNYTSIGGSKASHLSLVSRNVAHAVNVIYIRGLGFIYVVWDVYGAHLLHEGLVSNNVKGLRMIQGDHHYIISSLQHGILICSRRSTTVALVDHSFIHSFRIFL